MAAGDGAAIAQVAADRTLTMTLPRPISSKPPVTVLMRLPDGWSQQPGDRGEVTLRPVNEGAKLPYMEVLVSAENLEPSTMRQVLQRSVITPLKTSVPDVQVRRVITDAHRDHRFVLSLEIESALTEPSRYVETRCLAYVDSGGFAVELKGKAAMDDAKLVDVFEAACASLEVQALPAGDR